MPEHVNMFSEIVCASVTAGTRIQRGRLPSQLLEHLPKHKDTKQAWS
jgi:hypothetical protein